MNSDTCLDKAHIEGCLEIVLVKRWLKSRSLGRKLYKFNVDSYFIFRYTIQSFQNLIEYFLYEVHHYVHLPQGISGIKGIISTQSKEIKL